VAHFKLSYSRAFFVRAYFLQTHEMLFDAHNTGGDRFDMAAKQLLFPPRPRTRLILLQFSRNII
jgi:hypothetical protein